MGDYGLRERKCARREKKREKDVKEGGKTHSLRRMADKWRLLASCVLDVAACRVCFCPD